MEISSIASGKRSVARSVPLMVFTKCGGYLFPIHLSGSSSTPPSPRRRRPHVCCLLCSSSSFFLPLVLGDIYLLKEVVTKDVARNFTAAAPPTTTTKAIRATPLPDQVGRFGYSPINFLFPSDSVRYIKVFDLPRVLADDWTRSPGSPIVFRVFRHHFRKEM